MEHQNQVTAEIGSCLTMYSEKMKDFREVEDQDLGYISHEINRTEAGLLRSLVDRRIKRLEGKKELFGSSSLIKRLKKSGQSKYISTAKFKSENMVGEAYYFSDDGKLIGILGLLRNKERTPHSPAKLG